MSLEQEILEAVDKHGRGGTPESKVLGPEIYGEFYLPPLAGMKAIRQTKERFAQLGLDAMVAGHTVLDVGCHIGSLSFYAHQAGATHVTGVEQNIDRLIIAKKIRLFNNIPVEEMSFFKNLSDVSEKHDIVMCMSVDDYVDDKEAFYYELLDRCLGTLIIESNIQEYATHPLATFCMESRLNYKWFGEVVDKMPYGKDRVRNLFMIEVR